VHARTLTYIYLLIHAIILLFCPSRLEYGIQYRLALARVCARARACVCARARRYVYMGMHKEIILSGNWRASPADRFAWRRTPQLSLLFTFSVTRYPRVLFLRIAVNMTFLLTIFKKRCKNFPPVRRYASHLTRTLFIVHRSLIS
jgi:cobalamin synthase